MIYHVLPGDSLVDKFEKSGIAGEVIVFREALITGPVDAASRNDLWNERAAFVLSEYGEDEIAYHETVADEVEKLASIGEDDEVNLWFEYELFCSVNLWFCLSILAETDADVYRVEPSELTEEQRWKGFGQSSADDLIQNFEYRNHLNPADIALGHELWKAYRDQDLDSLLRLSRTPNKNFPNLAEVCDAATRQDEMPKQILSEIAAEGITEFDQIFSEFQKRAGVYGFGDLQVQRLLENKA